MIVNVIGCTSKHCLHSKKISGNYFWEWIDQNELHLHLRKMMMPYKLFLEVK